jgi:hypothetical protein
LYHPGCVAAAISRPSSPARYWRRSRLPDRRGSRGTSA